jgi:hypothetical protein
MSEINEQDENRERTKLKNLAIWFIIGSFLIATIIFIKLNIHQGPAVLIVGLVSLTSNILFAVINFSPKVPKWIIKSIVNLVFYMCFAVVIYGIVIYYFNGIEEDCADKFEKVDTEIEKLDEMFKLKEKEEVDDYVKNEIRKNHNDILNDLTVELGNEYERCRVGDDGNFEIIEDKIDSYIDSLSNN